MPAPATALVPQLMAVLVSPDLGDTWGCSEKISRYLGMSSKKELLELWRSVGWQDRVCAKAEAESKK